MIAIIDYEMGNLRSVQKGFEYMGKDAVISGDPKEMIKAEKIVLPGVGAFAKAVYYLENLKLKNISMHFSFDCISYLRSIKLKTLCLLSSFVS